MDLAELPAGFQAATSCAVPVPAYASVRLSSDHREKNGLRHPLGNQDGAFPSPFVAQDEAPKKHSLTHTYTPSRACCVCAYMQERAVWMQARPLCTCPTHSAAVSVHQNRRSNVVSSTAKRGLPGSITDMSGGK